MKTILKIQISETFKKTATICSKNKMSKVNTCYNQLIGFKTKHNTHAYTNTHTGYTKMFELEFNSNVYSCFRCVLSYVLFEKFIK